MPCDSGPSGRSEREAAIREAAQLYRYACRKIPRECPAWVLKEADDYYTSDDRDKIIPMLCALIRGLNEDQLNRIVYNARDADSRRLADWWERHLEIDRRREEKERTEARLNSEYGPKKG